VIAIVAAKHPHFRMMRNARKLAYKHHGHVAVLANGSWDFAGGGGSRHVRKIR
jgi:hypothetical protein